MNTTTATHDRPETKTVKFNDKTIEYLTDTVDTDVSIILGPSKRVTLLIAIYADAIEIDEHCDRVESEPIWSHAVELDAAASRHWKDYETIARQAADCRARDLRGDYDR
jgi:hypothetical protein